MIGDKKVFIIAEAGVNHNGSIIIAKKLIEKAKEAGVDAIKFQTWKTENVITKDAEKPNYQTVNGTEENQYDMLKNLELTYEEFVELKAYCDEIGIMFMSTADEYESALFLNDLVSIIKVGSAELTDLLFLKKLAGFRKPIILSTGMGSFEEIDAALNVLYQENVSKESIVVLHANTAYPTPFEDANLLAIKSINERSEVATGYSDHTMGIEATIAAVSLGAKVIEKHFTLDKSMKGPDHKASIEPEELKNMVNAIRNIEKALGDGVKKTTKSENENIQYVRKSIVAKRRIKKGEQFTEENITVKRPAGGISPDKWFEVINTIADRDYDIDDYIISKI